MKASSCLPVGYSELLDKQEPQTSIVPVDSTSSLPVDPSELSVSTAASSLLVDKGELPTEQTPVEPIIGSNPLVEISESLEPTVEHDTSDVQVDQNSESSSQVDESRLPETITVSSPQVDENRPLKPIIDSSPEVDKSRPSETITVSSPEVEISESLEAMRGSATVGITTTEVIESDNSLPEQTSASSPPIEQSELITESVPEEPTIVDSTAAKQSKPRSKSVSEPLTQAALAKRLGVDRSRVSRVQSQSNFATWSQERDPDGIAWKFNSKTKRFYPQPL